MCVIIYVCVYVSTRSATTVNLTPTTVYLTEVEVLVLIMNNHDWR